MALWDYAYKGLVPFLFFVMPRTKVKTTYGDVIKMQVLILQLGWGQLKFWIFFFNFEKRLTRCSTYLCIHWLLLVCALTWHKTSKLGISGGRSNQLSYPTQGKFWICNRCPGDAHRRVQDPLQSRQENAK